MFLPCSCPALFDPHSGLFPVCCSFPTSTLPCSLFLLRPVPAPLLLMPRTCSDPALPLLLPCSYSGRAPAPTLLLPCSFLAPAQLLPCSCPTLAPDLLLLPWPAPTLLLPCSCSFPYSCSHPVLLLPCFNFCPALPCSCPLLPVPCSLFLSFPVPAPLLLIPRSCSAPALLLLLP